MLRTPLRRGFASKLALPTRVSTRSLVSSFIARNAVQPVAAVPPKKSSNAPLFIGLGAAVASGLGLWLYASNSDTAKEAATAVKFVPAQADYQKIYNKIAAAMDADDYDDGSFGPILVRLAWHSSGTYDKVTNTGGSNYATMRFSPESLHGANAGLAVARSEMDKIKAEFPFISHGDLWTLAGVTAIQEMGGPTIPWRPGRVDGFDKDATPDGRLPDATQGSDHLRAIFGRMGFNDREIVALSGAHALGRCHIDRSGFDGPWTFSPTTFSNEFFKLLMSEKWVWRKWNGPKQLQDQKTRTLMMLPTDYVLVQDKSFKQFVKKYAEDEGAFFKDFSAAFSRLLELGVPEGQWVTSTPWQMKATAEMSP